MRLQFSRRRLRRLLFVRHGQRLPVVQRGPARRGQLLVLQLVVSAEQRRPVARRELVRPLQQPLFAVVVVNATYILLLNSPLILLFRYYKQIVIKIKKIPENLVFACDLITIGNKERNNVV
jgi:hypothetical protein